MWALPMLRAAMTVSVLALGACGVTYHSPEVRSQAAGVDVRVVALTSETVLVANRSAYDPKALPAAFYQVAGYGGGVRGAGALPVPPDVPQDRPQPLELRAPPQMAPEAYRIGVGDVVLLSTHRGGSTVAELSGLLAAETGRQGYTVRDDGRISIPDVGLVDLAGLTLDEAEARLFDVLVRNQIDPAFSLEVSQFNSRRVAVGGEVGRPGLFPLTLNPLTLGEALAAAGGLNVRDRDYASIRIYRNGSLYQIPLDDYFSDVTLQRRILMDGDAIYVDTTYDLDRALAFYRQQIEVITQRSQSRSVALSELQTEMSLRGAVLSEQRQNFRDRLELGAEDRDYVYLTGEVAKQSRFPLPYGQKATLADVLYESGGFPTTTGNPRHIYVLRPSPDPADFGAVTAWHLDGSNAVNMTLATRLEMRPNDLIFVEEQPITKWGRALQQSFGLVLGAASGAIGG